VQILFGWCFGERLNEVDMIPELSNFKKTISDKCSNELIQRLLEENSDYIWEAFEKVEQFWFSEFSQMKSIHLVLLSEAPLFGSKESYFYNPDFGASSFFGYKDYTESFEGWGPSLEARPRDCANKKKRELLYAMRKIGVLVLDIFPFALNTKTAFSYTSLGRDNYRQLFEDTESLYLRPKLKQVRKRLDTKGKFVFRYKRVRDAAHSMVKQALEETQGFTTQLVEEHVSGVYGRLNRQRLRSIYCEITEKRQKLKEQHGVKV
jgi:hypothetical protein